MLGRRRMVGYDVAARRYFVGPSLRSEPFPSDRVRRRPKCRCAGRRGRVGWLPGRLARARTCPRTFVACEIRLGPCEHARAAHHRCHGGSHHHPFRRPLPLGQRWHPQCLFQQGKCIVPVPAKNGFRTMQSRTEQERQLAHVRLLAGAIKKVLVVGRAIQFN